MNKNISLQQTNCTDIRVEEHIFLGYVAPRNIKSYVPRPTEKHIQTSAPRLKTKEHIRTYVPRLKSGNISNFTFLDLKPRNIYEVTFLSQPMNISKLMFLVQPRNINYIHQ
jgi:hypothetical protein